MLPQVANALMRVPQSGGQIPGQGQFGAGYLPPGYAQPLGGPNTQFPLNPGAPQQPQTFPPVPMPPVGQGGGPVAQPGGGNAPPPQMGGGGVFQGHGMPDIQAMKAGLADFRNSLNDWRDARPAWAGFDGSRDDWRAQMQDWRGDRPSFDPRSFLFGGQTPATQTAPASSFGGPALPQGLAALPGGASQPPGVMSLIPSANPGQLPTYRGG